MSLIKSAQVRNEYLLRAGPLLHEVTSGDDVKDALIRKMFLAEQAVLPVEHENLQAQQISSTYAPPAVQAHVGELQNDSECLVEQKQKAYKEGFDLGVSEGEVNGYEEGFKKGEEAAKKAVEAAYASSIQALHDVIGNIESCMQDNLINSKDFIQSIVLLATAKVFGKHVNSDVGCCALIEQTLINAASQNVVSIRVSPSTYQLIHAENVSAQNFPHLQTLLDRFVADETVSSPGCIVECDSANIDALLSTQLEKLMKSIRRLGS